MYTEAFEKLASAISRGALVLTVNARLSRHLAARYDLVMSSGGKMAWPTPQVMPFSSWVAGLIDEYALFPALAGLRAQALWEKVVSSDPLVTAAFPSSGVARASYEALRLMREYGISLPGDEIYLTEEAKALKRWAGAYAGELKRLGFTGEHELLADVRRLIDRGAAVPGEVVLAGYDEFSPAVSAVTSALAGRGVKLSLWPSPEETPPEAQVSVVACEDELDEVLRAARWVRSVYRPGMKVGVIVPDLASYRRSIIREFTAELSPASVLPGEARPPVFNVSLGAPLSDEPLVGAALGIISTDFRGGEPGELAALLSSPFFAGEDAHEIARVEFRLKEQNRTEVSLPELRTLFMGRSVSGRLGAWLDWLSGAGKKQTPGEWGRSFAALLEKVGFLGGVALSSAEYQALGAWNSALEAFSSLDDVLGKISRSEAAGRLSSIAKETIHQVETPDADIQVLGMLEASGLWFDHVRVIGCHEYALPKEPSPNPFLPVALQAAKGVPHSTGQREFEFAKAVCSRLLRSAPEVTVSWPLTSDGREIRVSPLFRKYAVREEGEMPSSRLVDMPEVLLEDAPPDLPVPVGEAERAGLRGGTSILKNQSICPFRAFACHRLFAVTLPSTELGLKSEARGTILHEAMRLFWDEVRSSKALMELKASGRLEAYADKVAAKALEAANLPPPLSARFRELERQRLSALVLEWARLECARGTAFQVKTTELERTLDIGGLAVRARADRVDELEDGGEAVLDYKTGVVNRKDWLTRRPMDPQLLVYSAGAGFSAVSFARVVPGECKFLGIARQDAALPGVKKYDDDRFRTDAGGLDWDGLMAFWKETLEGLAKDFLAGACEVDPNNLPNNDRACKNCDFGPLCRVSELSGRVDADENDEETA